MSGLFPRPTASPASPTSSALVPASSAAAPLPQPSPALIDKLPNELLVRILSYISDRRDVWAFLMTQRRWFQVGIDRIWVRPTITSASTLRSLCAALETETREYAPLMRRLNFSAVAHHLSPETLRPFLVCTTLERLALACAPLEDEGLIIEIIKRNPYLNSLDLSGVSITDRTLKAVAEFGPQIQGLYVSNCPEVTNAGICAVARGCKYLRRLKLAGTAVSNEGVLAVAAKCPLILELDASQCKLADATVSALFGKLRQLREVRLNGNVDLSAKILDGVRLCENLRLVDFGSCPSISDATVERLVELAPRLHQVALGKCYNVTDRGLQALATLEQNLHYVHLGHCARISDRGIAILVKACPRLQYVDVANCARLTNQAVAYLSHLPRLRRIGLVKCTEINDEGILWLSKRAPNENTLERVHLSYCNNISFQAVTTLVNSCPRLTHLSLTGVSSFMRPDLAQFCRQPPPDLTQHQQSVFCVFSGQGVLRLRDYMNRSPPTPYYISLFPSTRIRGGDEALDVARQEARAAAFLAAHRAAGGEDPEGREGIQDHHRQRQQDHRRQRQQDQDQEGQA